MEHQISSFSRSQKGCESRASSPRTPIQKAYFDFGDVKMSGQMRERVLRVMKIRGISFSELALEALEMKVASILSGAGAISVLPTEPIQTDSCG